MTTYTTITKTANNGSILAYYACEGDFTDSTGTYNGTVSGATLTDGKIGSAYIYDGSTDYTSVVLSSNIITSGTFAVSLWVRPDTEDTGTHALAGRWDAAGGSRQFICALDSANAYFGLVQSDTTNKTYQPTLSLGSGSWHHLVYMANGSSLEVYADGVRKGTGLTYDGTLQTPAATNLHFGKLRESDNIWNLDGTLDEVGIWDKELTPAQITYLYNSGSGRTYPITLTDLTNYRDFNNCSINGTQSENNSVSSFTVTFDNEDGVKKSEFNVGTPVDIYVEKDTNPPTNKLFSGAVDGIDYLGLGLKENLTITGKDYTSILKDTTVEPTVYNNLDAGSIVKHIIANNTSGLTTGSVDDTGTTISHISFRHTPVFDAVKQLAEESNYYFFVDPSKNLNFKPKGNISAGITLGSANVITARFIDSDQELYNAVWVYGDRSLLAPEVVTETSDGTGSVISLANKPHNIKVQDSGTNIAKGGIFELNVSPGSDIIWLSDFDAKEIIWTSGNVPASGAISTINYDRSVSIIKFAEDRPSQVKYGIKDKVIVDKNIKNPLQARDLALTTLANHYQPRTQGTILLRDVPLLIPGNTVNVNLPNHNINNETQSIISTFYNLNNVTMTEDEILTVTTKEKIGDFTDTIKQIMLDIKKLQASEFEETDVLTRLESSIGSEGLKVNSWQVWSQGIGNSFILGHPVNGILGSPALGVNGSQIFLGDYKAGSVLQASGAD